MSDLVTARATRRKSIAIIAALALAAVVLGSVGCLVVFMSDQSARSEKQIADLSARIDSLETDQQLASAEQTAVLASSPTTATKAAAPETDNAPIVPIDVSSAENGLGIFTVLLKFGTVAQADSTGWQLSADTGTYLDGNAAISAAAARGDAFRGSYYVVDDHHQMSVRLLRNTPVRVNGSTRSTAGGNISATEFIASLGKHLKGAQRLADRWYWVKLTRTNDALQIVEPPPQ